MFNSNSDPFVNALKSFGYNLVRLPKADIQPLLLFSRNGDNLDRLGAVTKLLTPGAHNPPPQPQPDTPAANINGSRTGNMKIGLGLSILGNIIGAMGGNLGVEAQYQRARSAVFEFQSVTESRIDIIELDQYLGDADINPASVFVSQLLDADKLYVVTAILKSTKFTFEARTGDGAELKVDVPVVQQIVGGSVKVSAQSTSAAKLTYEGQTPLVFGFQAVQLFFQDGQYTSLKPAINATMRAVATAGATSGDATAATGSEAETKRQPEILMTDKTFVRLREI